MKIPKQLIAFILFITLTLSGILLITINPPPYQILLPTGQEITLTPTQLAYIQIAIGLLSLIISIEAYRKK